MTQYAAVAIGGAVGSMTRYFVSGAVYQRFGTSFPYGTLAVNVIGCFLIGLIMEMTQDRYAINPAVKTLLTVGFLGGFTTFSTYSYETLALVRDGMALRALVNAGGSVVAGLFAAWLGIVAGRLI